MNPRVKSAKAVANYKIEIKFTNGEVRHFDMKPYLSYPVYYRLKDISYFQKLNVQLGTICWPNEEDICPDTLYLESA